MPYFTNAVKGIMCENFLILPIENYSKEEAKSFQNLRVLEDVYF